MVAARECVNVVTGEPTYCVAHGRAGASACHQSAHIDSSHNTPISPEDKDCSVSIPLSHVTRASPLVKSIGLSFLLWVGTQDEIAVEGA
eukprot:10630011-Heterocapsa_arctica.AAC.1